MTQAHLRARVAPLFPGRGNRRTRRVGIEHELLTIDMASGSSAGPDRIRRATDGAAYADHLSFEPGGQLELSLPCASGPEPLLARLAADIRAARADCLAIGVLLQQSPVDSRSHVPLRLDSPRYVAMQGHFDTVGPAGRRMMRQTASTQVCLDWWPGRAGLEQWRLLHLSAPFLAAAFARSTGPDSRLSTWLAVDPERTSFDDRLLRGEDPVTAYAAFAAGATVFTTPGDVDQHLSTLFPAVRPRGGYLEVRYLDVQPEAQLPTVLGVLTALAYEEECRVRALARLAPLEGQLAEHWAAAAAGHSDTVALGRELVAMVLPRALAGAA